ATEQAGEPYAAVEQGLVVCATRREGIGQEHLGVGANAATPGGNPEAEGDVRQPPQQRERGSVAGDVGPAERNSGVSGSDFPELGGEGRDDRQGERGSPAAHGVILPPILRVGSDAAERLQKAERGTRK